jgi:hypothetical protein
MEYTEESKVGYIISQHGQEPECANDIQRKEWIHDEHWVNIAENRNWPPTVPKIPTFWIQ